MIAEPIWFDEPLPAAAAEECCCRFSGDQADASDCPEHGVSREPAVRLAGHESDCERCPF
jgi:hypothetical protein